MKKHLLSLFCFLLFNNALFAAYLIKYPITVTQPNGETVQCYVTGDEYHHRVHDENGYTIIRDPQTGYLVYAVLENDELVSSGYLVGKIDPKTTKLSPDIDISAKKWKQLRKQFWDNTPSKQDLRSSSVELRANRNVGTLNNLVVYIRFSNDEEFTTPVSTYDGLFNKDEAGSSLYRYFYDISHEKLSIKSTFYPQPTSSTIASYKDIRPRSDYENATDENRWELESGLIKRAIMYIRNQVPSNLNLDFDGDGWVDNICFIVQGNFGLWSSLLWPHMTGIYDPELTINGKMVRLYNFQIENHLLTVGNGRQSVLVHEMYHTLGAPDFYRYDNTTINPVGSWDVMCNNTIPPQSSTAYTSYKYGRWSDSSAEIPEITQNGTYTLHNVWSETNNCYKIASPNSTTEFFMIEYRNKSVIWDSQLPGSGLIIYRINSALNGNSGGPPDEMYVFRPGASNNTTNGELYNAFFNSQTGRSTFSDTSDPPCFLSDDSPGLSGIVISEIGPSGGETMSFKVTFPTVGSPVAQPATNTTRTGFTANWNPSTGATSYLLSVYYLKDGVKTYTGGGFSNQSVGNVLSYNVTGLNRNVSTEWYYTVKAVSGGVPTEDSNEISVQLAPYDPVTCNYASNGQTDKGKTYYYWVGGYGYVTGTNALNHTEYAEKYSLQEPSKLSGIKIDIRVLQNNSNNPEYTKITLKVWKVGNNGLPGEELYAQNVSFNNLTWNENVIDFTTPVLVPSSFFVGYQVYNSPTTLDDFAVYSTLFGIDNNTAYRKVGSIWSPFSNSNENLSLYVFPNLCSFVPEPDFTSAVASPCGNFTWDFTNTSLASSETTWLWDFGDEQTSTEKNPEHTYNAAGNYTVTLTAENIIGKSSKTATITVTEQKFIWEGANNNWNNSSNWREGVVPCATSKVIIPKSDSYPILTTPTTVAEIHFEPGAQIGRQDLLTAGKTFVQYDFGSAASRGRWHMLSVPLQEAYPGDFTFGGYPSTWVRTFTTEEKNGVIQAYWETARASTSPLSAGDGFVLWLNPDGSSNDKGLKLSEGILELPFFDNPSVLAGVHPNHEYTPGANGDKIGTSKFYNFTTEGTIIPNENYTVDRSLKAYQLAGGSTFTKNLNFGNNSEAVGTVALAGNPYMAALNFTDLYNANSSIIKDNYQVWTVNNGKAGYAGYNKEGMSGLEGVNPGQYIAPLQAFIVEKIGNATPSQLTFGINMANANEKPVLRTSGNAGNKLDIVARNETAGVRTFIAKREDGQDSFGDRDSRKLMSGFSNVPEIYTLKPYNNRQVAVGANIINSDNQLIPLGLATAYSGDLTFTFTGMDTYGAYLSLVDAVENKEIDLTGLVSYEYRINYVPPKVNGETVACEDRFFIRISKTPTGLPEVAFLDQVNVYNSNGRIQVVSGTNNLVRQVSVYSLQGVLLYAANNINAISHTVTREWPAGVYIVKVVSERNTQNVKLMLRM